MPLTFIYEAQPVIGMRLIKKLPGVEIIKVKRSSDSHLPSDSYALLKGRVTVEKNKGSDPLDLCVALYGRGRPFNLDNGRYTPMWYRLPAKAVADTYPCSFPISPLDKNGRFSITIVPRFFSSNAYENLIIIAEQSFFNNEGTADQFPWTSDLKSVDSAMRIFYDYLNFLKNHRAYLTDFSMQTLIANPHTVLSFDLTERTLQSCFRPRDKINCQLLPQI